MLFHSMSLVHVYYEVHSETTLYVRPAYRKRRFVSPAKPGEECPMAGECLIGPEAPRQPTWLPRLRDS